MLPPGYLADVYGEMRREGVLCIADEVQVGFGRVGSAFWGFQLAGPGVVPDMVTVGKPAGNGFPLGGLVTTCVGGKTGEGKGGGIQGNSCGGGAADKI